MERRIALFALAAASFAVAAHALSGGEITEKYYRLAIREIVGGDIVQLGEFSLYASDGSRVNGNGMKLVPPRAAKSLAPGECFASRTNFAPAAVSAAFGHATANRVPSVNGNMRE